MERICASSTPTPLQMSKKRPVPAESCPPVMAVVPLSEMITVRGEQSFTASRSPVMPEWVKVESPITQRAGRSPASAAPLAMVMEAPISTQLLMVL